MSRNAVRMHRYWPAALFLLLLSLGAGEWLVPRLIGQAYNGRSLSILNEALAGRGEHSLNFYVAQWKHLWRISFACLVGVLAVAYGAAVTRGTWMASLGRWWGKEARAVSTIRELVTVAFGVGFVVGSLEAIGVLAASMLRGLPNWGVGYSIEVIWMAPLANALVFAVAGLALGLVLRVVTKRVTCGIVLLALTWLGLYAAARSLRVGLAPWATGILALGVAVRVSQYLGFRWAEVGLASRRLLAAAVPVLLVLAVGMHWADWRPDAPSGDVAPGRQNILLIVWDTVRARNLSVYGAPRVTSPHLDELASESITFEHAYATAPWTLPSHSSLFTGLDTHELSGSWYERLDDAAPTLAETLQALGYRTGGFVANVYYAGARSGLARGFGQYHDQPVSWRLLLSNSWITRGLMATVHGEPVIEPWGSFGRKNAEDVNREFIRWLSQDPATPFFAFLNYMNAHHPYPSPPPFDTLFAQVPPRIRMDWGSQYSAEELADHQVAYDQGIAYMDDQVGLLLDSLEALGILDNTIVILTSDHGEQFGERDLTLTGHGNSLYLSTLHVPLMVRLPNGEGAGTRVFEAVSLKDVAATSLDIIGLRREASGIPGASLRGLWLGLDTLDRRPILSELKLDRPNGEEVEWGRHMRSLIDPTLHYILNGDGTEELYRAEDTAEQANLASEVEWLATLRQFRSGLPSN